MDRANQIAKNLNNVLSEIENHKTVKKVILVAVTKYGDYDDLEMAYNAGQRDFGENRVEELRRKQDIAFLKGHHDIRWHFIGNIQSNKISEIVSIQNLVAIHSVSKLSHFEKINKEANSLKDPIDIYFQVNTSNEEEKSGIETIEELVEIINYSLVHKVKNIVVKGLMTMGKIRTDNIQADAQICFSHLREMKEKLAGEFQLDLGLSMGMSNDYKIALENGATVVRVGSTIFK